MEISLSNLLCASVISIIEKPGTSSTPSNNTIQFFRAPKLQITTRFIHLLSSRPRNLYNHSAPSILNRTLILFFIMFVLLLCLPVEIYDIVIFRFVRHRFIIRSVVCLNLGVKYIGLNGISSFFGGRLMVFGDWKKWNFVIESFYVN